MQARASERGKRLAGIRWARERERHLKLAALTADEFPSKIILRVVVIRNETTVQEAVIRDWDSDRETRRKLRAVLTAPVAAASNTSPRIDSTRPASA